MKVQKGNGQPKHVVWRLIVLQTSKRGDMRKVWLHSGEGGQGVRVEQMRLYGESAGLREVDNN